MAGTKGIDGAVGLKGEIGPMGPAGERGPMGEVGQRGPMGEKGLDGFVPDVSGFVIKEVNLQLRTMLAAIPRPKDGTNGLDGKSVSIDDIRPLVVAEVAKIPIPRDGEDGKNGTSVTIDDVAPLIAASVTKAFDAMPKPKDGLGVKTAVIDHEGRLLITMSDGAVVDLGTVVGQKGRDGMPGVPGRPGLDTVGKDGQPGRDGTDGLGLEDLDLVFEQEKGWLLRFQNATRTKDLPIPLPFDAGVWQAGTWYPQGAGVTVKGAFFIARERTRTRPDDGTPESAKAWRLAVKGGRDGKPGTNGKDGKDWSEE